MEGAKLINLLSKQEKRNSDKMKDIYEFLDEVCEFVDLNLSDAKNFAFFLKETFHKKVFEGTTKYVMDCGDYVIKIPKKVKDLKDKVCENYCEKEYQIYLWAKAKGFAKSFACIVPYKNIYLQEKVAIMEGAGVEVTEPFEDYDCYVDKHLTGFDVEKHEKWLEIWQEDYVRKFGVGGLNLLFKELYKKFNFNLEKDLYIGNVGYNENGCPVILDYSGI